MMSARPWLLIAPLIISACSAADSRLTRRDQWPPLGTPHCLDGGLTVYAEEVAAAGEHVATVFGQSHVFTDSRILSRVYLQTCENLSGDERCVDVALASFLVSITSDPEGSICQAFLVEVVDYWRSKDPGYRRNHEVLPAKLHAFVKDDDFLLYKSPERYWPGAQWLLYTEGRLFVVELLESERERGLGALQSFVVDNMSFEFGHGAFRPTYRSYLPPDELLALVDSRMVKCHVSGSR